ncbi:methyltransferase domain-containing protein [Pseudonocardia xishanensis]|uniref:methyltransferase domain-containing protein n=1 Tax=Pseudonocardia xishanensis TaxID=630995 RepID=UPI0031E61DE3
MTIPGLREWVSLAVPRTGRTVRLTPESRALPSETADAVVLDRVLPLVERPEELFDEVRRILRPAGSLVVVVPSPGRSPAELRDGVRRRDLLAGWPCRTAVEHPAWLLAAADFALLGDTRAVFRVPDPDPADLVAVAAWPTTGIRPRRSARPLPVGFRRLVARR